MKIFQRFTDLHTPLDYIFLRLSPIFINYLVELFSFDKILNNIENVLILNDIYYSDNGRMIELFDKIRFNKENNKLEVHCYYEDERKCNRWDSIDYFNSFDADIIFDSIEWKC